MDEPLPDDVDIEDVAVHKLPLNAQTEVDGVGCLVGRIVEVRPALRELYVTDGEVAGFPQ